MRVEWLREAIHQHNRLYHERDEQEISDSDYDDLFRELRDWEDAYPELVTQNSPTQLVGASPSNAFSEVEHGAPMLSLDNVFNSSEMEAYDRRLAKLLHDEDEREYSAEPKLDGVALSLLYRHGRLVRAATRGDGRVGEDVSHTAQTIRSIPHRLSGVSVPRQVEIRGEVFMPLSAFRDYNKRAEDEGWKPLVNPRNAAAGALRQKPRDFTHNAVEDTYRQLDSKLAALRCLDFFAHGVGQTDDLQDIFRQSDLLKVIESWRVKVCPDTEHVSGAAGCAKYYRGIAEKRNSFDYALDGVVFKLERFDLRDQVGASSRAPRWAVAQKFPAEEKLARVRDIEYQVGRTGALTPVARLEPVFVGGATVRNATLHNYCELLSKDVRVGDMVVVRRAGDVIPEVVNSLQDRRTDKLPIPELPKRCPECNSKVVLPKGEPIARCTGGLVCPAQRRARILHFASKHALDIEGLGERRVIQLMENKLIKDFPDIFRLEQHRKRIAELAHKEPVGEEQAAKLLNSIDKAKNTSLDRLLVALNVPSVGPTRAKRLAKHFNGLIPLSNANISELRETDGVTAAVAKEIGSFFQQESNWRIISGLIDAGVNWPHEDIEQIKQRAAESLSKAEDANREHEPQALSGEVPRKQLKNAIRRIARKDALNIKAPGFKWVNQIVDRGLVKEVHEVFDLKQDQLATLIISRTIGEKSTNKLLEAIESAKRPKLERLIYSLGIPDVGRVTASALAKHFSSMEALCKATDVQLRQVPDIGEIVSQHLLDYFSKDENLDVIRALEINGVNWTESEVTTAATEGPLKGSTFVLTGTLEGMTRNGARQLIIAAGGRVVGSVSKNTNYLVLGTNPGKKHAKAIELGIKVLTLDQFLKKMGQE